MNDYELPPMPEERDLFLPSARQSDREFKSFTSITKAIICILREKSTPQDFQLKELAESLGVDLKRLYIMCNVFEGLGMVARKGKNTCEWLGFSKMFPSLKKLYEMAEESYLNLYQQGSSTKLEEKLKLNVTMMTQKLLMIFLVIPKPGFLKKKVDKKRHLVLLMEDAAKIIFGDQSLQERAASKMKLHDVCRILVGLGLVREERVSGRVGFSYEGPCEFSDKDYEDEVEYAESKVTLSDEERSIKVESMVPSSPGIVMGDMSANPSSNPL